MPRVRDVHGHVVWRVRVAKNEMTCLVCGEVAIVGRDGEGSDRIYCPRCAMSEEGHWTEHMNSLTPTISYLREGEFECV